MKNKICRVNFEFVDSKRSASIANKENYSVSKTVFGSINLTATLIPFTVITSSYVIRSSIYMTESVISQMPFQLLITM